MDFAALVGRQRAFFQSGATRPLEFRRAQLRKLREAIESGEELLGDALHQDLRKSAYQAYTTETGLILGEVGHALRHLSSWARPRRRRAPLLAWPSRGMVRPEPRGVALIIGPWNYPLQLLLSPLASALAAGNCVVLKPSEFAPHTADAVARMLGEVFPAEQVAVVEGGSETAEALLRERFDHIFFTGSTRVGRAVMTAAARHLATVTLELGGKSPCLVCADAPPDITARRIVWGKFMNAGQTCVAPDFVLVDQRLGPALVAAMKQALGEFYGADPQRSPDYGRIINQRHFDRLIRALEGSTIAHGARRDAADLYLEPTIVTDPAPASALMQEEIFGPILPVVQFADLADALALLRARPTPLALYLFTRDSAVRERVLAEVPSGGAAINDTVTHMVGPALPFGGLGESGMGAYHGEAGFRSFTHYRSVLRRSAAWDHRLLFPPPRVSLATLKRVYRFLLGD